MTRGFFFLIALILVTACSPAAGQEKTLKISVNATPQTLHEGDLLKVTIQLQAKGIRNLPDPGIPPQFPGFQVVGQSTQQQFYSTQKGSVIQSTIVLTMLAISTGTHTIPSIKVESNGITRSSRPIQIKVLKGKGSHPQGGEQPQQEQEPEVKDLKTI